MKFSKILSFFAIIFFLTASSFSVNALAQTAKDKPNDLIDQLIGNSIEGVWSLNIDESDDVGQKIQTLLQRASDSPDKAKPAEQNETPAISISILPPERLALLGGKDEITINEFYTDVVLTRTLKTDGQTHVYQANKNADVAVSAIEEKSKLSIETLSPRDNHMTETYELSAKGSKLKVTIRISDSNFKELLILQRIYDRAFLDDLSDYN